jgi:hypothetical protein
MPLEFRLKMAEEMLESLTLAFDHIKIEIKKDNVFSGWRMLSWNNNIT